MSESKEYVSESTLDNPPREPADPANQLPMFPPDAPPPDGEPDGDLLFQYELTLKLKKKGAKPVTMTLVNEENYASNVYERLNLSLGWKRNKRVILAILGVDEKPESADEASQDQESADRPFLTSVPLGNESAESADEPAAVAA